VTYQVGAVIFAVVTGLLMALIFYKDEAARTAEQIYMPDAEAKQHTLLQDRLYLLTMVLILVFTASANVPLFNVLARPRLDPEQKSRYKRVVEDYCGRVLVPSFGIFRDPDLKACAGLSPSIRPMRPA
jgi:hypothetical protein